ncbi:MAG: SCP2 sterol-binding domain-containing protein [Thermoplasmata archaeon]
MSFPSTEWAEAFRTALNQNSAYQEAAKAWEGDIVFLIRAPESDHPSPGIHLVLAHGQCSAATFHPDARSVSSEFVYEGTPENWTRLLRKEIDPVKSILNGTFKIRGNPAKLMRFTRAAKELVETAASVPATL